jgi:hypothetical protein
MKILSMISILFILCSLLSLEPTSASSSNKSSLIDHGTQFWPNDMYAVDKTTWKAYKSGNTITVFEKTKLMHNSNYTVEYKHTIQKISKNKIRIKSYNGLHVSIMYKYTKMSVVDYYWKIFRPKEMYVW